MSHKFTPGPWVVSDERTQSGSPVKCVRRGDGKSAYNIAVLGDRMPSPAQWNANARLIAAAPELLAALQAFINGHRQFIAENPGIRKDGALHQALVLAAQALTKATGGSEGFLYFNCLSCGSTFVVGRGGK